MKRGLPTDQVSQEQRHVIRWSLLHIFTAVCFLGGLYYCREYMMMPDKVILMDDAGDLYHGSSGEVICRETADDIARKATSAFLDRSFEHQNRKACEALFGRTAQKSLRDIISLSSDEFAEQKIRQKPVIESVKIVGTNVEDQCLAFVRGILHRSGVYMNIPYYQKLEFTLGLRLMRSPDIQTYPLRVLRMIYEEQSVYDNKTGKKEIGK